MRIGTVWMVLTAETASAQPLTVTFRNAVNLPNAAVDQNGQPFTVTGLSGLMAYASSQTAPWYAVMDNSNKIVQLAMTFAGDGTITSASVTAGLSLAETRDFEGIERFGSDFMLADEATPALRVFDSNGFAGPVMPLPAVYSNIRPGYGVESLTRRDTVRWIANEEALVVDGPLSSETEGTVVRLQMYTWPFASAGPQYAYRTEPWHGSSISNARSGLCELVAIPDGRVISLERSLAFSLNGLFQTRIYEIDFAGATDVSGLPGLIGQTYTPVTKRLLYQGDQQNMEGLAVGRRTGPGRYLLVGIVDDGDPISVNRVVGFELAGVGTPTGCYANCDSSNSMVLLNANDFVCFLNAFAAGDSYANCDGSTSPPLLTGNDFVCFSNYFNQGCP